MVGTVANWGVHVLFPSKRRYWYYNQGSYCYCNDTCFFILHNKAKYLGILGNFPLKWHEKKKLIRGLKLVCRKFNKPFRWFFYYLRYGWFRSRKYWLNQVCTRTQGQSLRLWGWKVSSPQAQGTLHAGLYLCSPRPCTDSQLLLLQSQETRLQAWYLLPSRKVTLCSHICRALSELNLFWSMSPKLSLFSTN